MEISISSANRFTFENGIKNDNKNSGGTLNDWKLDLVKARLSIPAKGWPRECLQGVGPLNLHPIHQTGACRRTDRPRFP